MISAALPPLGIGFLGVSLAFDLTLLAMAFAMGSISGCHIDPGVPAGTRAGGRFDAAELPA